GAINSMNGVFGAYTDSIPMIVVGGQAKRETFRATAEGVEDLRQLGEQEVDSMRMVAPITKAHWLLSDPESALDIADEAIVAATTGRPGPVWIEVPVDVQGTRTNRDVADKPAPEREHQPQAVPQETLAAISA